MFKVLKKNMKNKKGFTLIELIVVIAILGILAVIAVPRLGGFTESAKQTNDEEIAAIVANAAAMFMASNSEKTPITSGTPTTGQVLVNTANIYTEGLIDYSDDTALLNALKSKKYTDGTEVVTYTIEASGNVSVEIGGTAKYKVTK